VGQVSAASPGLASVEPIALLGTWTFTRRLVDRVAAQYGRAVGTATFQADGDAVHWREDGHLHWGGRVLPVYRDLVISRAGDEWWVSFADGRPFHPWRFDETVQHPCRADTYRGRLQRSGDRLRIAWDVSGPTTDQRLVTTYRRR
jgi:Family of unknown function (DUF6314)